jgi:ribosome-interacting GTPase 1
MTTNPTYEYFEAEKKFLAAKTIEDKIAALEEVIRAAPKHKSSENLMANLRVRMAKLKAKQEKDRGKKKGRSQGVKREGDSQVTIIGFTNSGKSSLLSSLTEAKPKISDVPFNTLVPEIGALHLDGIIVQLVELPARLDDKEMLSIVKTSDLVLVLVTSLNELIEIASILKSNNVQTKKIVVLNKIDVLSEQEISKFKAVNPVMISAKNKTGLDELRQKIFENINLIRIYTKEPGKKPSERPIILKKEDSIRDLGEKIRKDFPERIISAKIWGSSAKFPGQTVGIEHVLHDKDIVELYLKK